jgi:hypothetical protein
VRDTNDFDKNSISSPSEDGSRRNERVKLGAMQNMNRLYDPDLKTTPWAELLSGMVP